MKLKKTIRLLAGTLLLQANLCAQSDTAIHYAETISESELRTSLQIIASPEMEGREAGSAGLDKTAAYLAGEFRKMGLDSVVSLGGYYQPFDIMKDTLMPDMFRAGRHKFSFREDYFIDRGTKKQNEFRAKEIVFGGYGIKDSLYNDYDKKDLKGKVVVIFPGEPKVGEHFLMGNSSHPSTWTTDLSKKIIAARSEGVRAVMIVNFDPALLLSGSEKARIEPPSEESYLPMISITPEAFVKIFPGPQATDILEAQKRQAALDQFRLVRRTKIRLSYGRKKILANTRNVLGWIEGRDKKDEYIIISAHYDHLGIEKGQVFYGADDNGSGTSALLALAEAFTRAKERGAGPRRSIVFIAFSGEETGLLGSQYYVSHPVFKLDSVSGVINIDMIGRVQAQKDTKRERHYLYVVGDDKRSSDLAGLVTSVNQYSGLKLDYRYNDPGDKEMIFYRSDHYSFARLGVPVVFFTNGTHADYHQSTDTVDKIDFDVMEKRVRFIFLVAWQMANQKEMLKRDLRIPLQ